MYLILSICCSTLIFIIFKSFNTFKINTLHAIIVNYFTAATFGYFIYEKPINPNEIIEASWFYGSLGLGFLFIAIFNVMALTAQKNGLSVASVASKMSVVIPIIFGILVYNENLNFQKGLGIILALVAVYLASIKASSVKKIELKNLWLPIILFLGSGIIDTSIKYIETTYLPNNGIPIFSATVFLVAGLIGLGIFGYRRFKGKIDFNFKAIIGGILLGIVNYYSIFFILKALNNELFESAIIFTINNVAIVMLSTLLGLFFFNEKLIKKNWLGFGLAVISIVLVTFA